MTNPVTLILFGILVGVFSGIMGLGGGSIMIPIMVLLMAMSQEKAHGTSLAVMIPPVALPAVLKYWKEGKVDWNVAIWTAIGVALGSYFGASIALSMQKVHKDLLRWVFGFTLIYVATYTVFGKEHLVRTLLMALLIVGISIGLFMLTRWHDGRTAVSAATPAAATVPSTSEGAGAP